MSDESRLDQIVAEYGAVQFGLALVAVSLLIAAIGTAAILGIGALWQSRIDIASSYATFVSGLATLLLVLITGWYATETRRMAREMKQAREQEIAPILTFDIEDRLTIRNVGNGPARDIDLTFSFDSEGDEMVRREETTLLTLGVGEKVELEGGYFDSLRSSENNIYQDHDRMIIDGTYDDGFGNTHDLQQEFNLSEIRSKAPR